MIPTLGTLVISSIAGLAWLSPVQIVAATAALVYGVGGLVALRVVENRGRASTDPIGASRPSHPPFRAAA